jgi:hypothetical protein
MVVIGRSPGSVHSSMFTRACSLELDMHCLGALCDRSGKCWPAVTCAALSRVRLVPDLGRDGDALLREDHPLETGGL